MARIDPTDMTPAPARISTNLSIDRQTPKADFGDRVKAGLDTAAGAVANGAAVAAPFVPGGAIISAAVSSVTQFAGGAHGGGGGGGGHGGGSASSAQYAMSGVTNVGGVGGINTSVGNGAVGGGGAAIPGASGGAAGVNAGGSPFTLPGLPGNSGVTTGMMNSELISAQQDNAKLLQMQVAMQRENQVFTTVSNVLKTRHDTVKNTIGNVR
jgi:hypothetical protein